MIISAERDRLQTRLSVILHIRTGYFYKWSIGYTLPIVIICLQHFIVMSLSAVNMDEPGLFTQADSLNQEGNDAI